MRECAPVAEGSPEHLDVLIVGAGLSGIGTAWHLQDRCPGKRYSLLEAREASGGTWDLFRYPGVRSDSDMQTLGYRFKPWTGAKALADGPEDFAGQIVHPQFWPEDIDYAGKRVLVIGSGATAVTLVPALARSGAGHVTMLQRSPSYILSLPDED